jgi:hypothetical protein
VSKTSGGVEFKDGTGNAMSGTAATITVDLSGLTSNGEGKITFSIAGEEVSIDATGKMDEDAIGAEILKGLGSLTVDGQTLTGQYSDGKITYTAGANGSINYTGDTTYTVEAKGTKQSDGTAGKAVLDFDGRNGGDVLGGTVTIGGQKYSFVEKEGEAAAGSDMK